MFIIVQFFFPLPTSIIIVFLLFIYWVASCNAKIGKLQVRMREWSGRFITPQLSLPVPFPPLYHQLLFPFHHHSKFHIYLYIYLFHFPHSLKIQLSLPSSRFVYFSITHIHNFLLFHFSMLIFV